MTFRAILATPLLIWSRHAVLIVIILTMIASAVIYPSDLEAYHAAPYDGAENALVLGMEDYGRHINTALALAVPILLRDVVGLKQLLVITIVGILATHGPKRLLNGLEVMGTRLGERPYGPDSRHNMPSGHSALASTVIWYLGRRYSWWLAVITVPVTLLTMWARVMLNAHTFSAVIAGALIGLLVAGLFVTRRATPVGH